MPKSFKEEILKISLELNSVLGNTMQDFNQKRRSEIKPSLNKEFSGICAETNPATEWLFGDNLSDQLKSSRTTATAVRATIKQNFRGGQRFTPYQSSSSKTSLNWRGPSRNRGAFNQRMGRGQYRRGNYQQKFPHHQ